MTWITIAVTHYLLFSIPSGDLLGISSFTRIDTVTVPDVFMSIITVSESNDLDCNEIQSVLEKDKDSIDYLGVRSDSDPLEFPDLYRAIKSVKPKGLKVMLISNGCNPETLDDLVGAGYVHSMDILIGHKLTEEQKECMTILEDNKCKFAVTVNASEHDEGSIRQLSKDVKGCFMFIIRTDKNKPLKKSELSALTSAAKASTWNVRTA